MKNLLIKKIKKMEIDKLKKEEKKILNKKRKNKNEFPPIWKQLSEDFGEMEEIEV